MQLSILLKLGVFFSRVNAIAFAIKFWRIYFPFKLALMSTQKFVQKHNKK